MIWKKKTQEAINHRVFGALSENINYSNQSIIGLPGSYLDDKVFSQEASFVHDAPYLSTLVQNPNHIGCHTDGASENFFSGTQELEREVIAICAEDILKAETASYDGYIASGGTEANLQAIWIYRNYFMREKKADLTQIAIVCSEDSHYSMAKGADMFQLLLCSIPVDTATRSIQPEVLDAHLAQLKSSGIHYVIVVANMMTTMFGSVDDCSMYVDSLMKNGLEFKMHVDAAYGGFYYPIINKKSELSFQNPAITSFTLDAHKIVQAPYGTGVFIIRKDWMKYATTKEASYVLGEDCTISGSRSGANAVAIWLIFAKYGFHGWFEKMHILQKRADWLSDRLMENNVSFFRNPFSNIITLNALGVPIELVQKYGLIPDNHHAPKWYKIVVMEHVTIDKLEDFLADFKPFSCSI